MAKTGKQACVLKITKNAWVFQLVPIYIIVVFNNNNNSIQELDLNFALSESVERWSY